METIALAPVDELVAIPGKEYDGMLWLYIFGMSFFKQHSFLGTGFCIVAYQL